MTALDEIREQLGRIERLVMAAIAKPEPAMTVRAFAKRVKLSRNTIQRRIAAGKVRKENGRIPASQLSKFLSSPTP